MTTTRRASYQQGTIARAPRRKGPDAWVFRYYQYDVDGNRTRVAEQFSDLDECPTRAKADKKAEALRKRINEERACVRFNDLADKYEREDMPANPHTRKTYLSNLKHLRSRWGAVRIDYMTANIMEIRAWLNSREPSPSPATLAGHYSRQTRQHLRNLLHRMFEDAMAWNLIPFQRNPMDQLEVTAGARPRVRRGILTARDITRLLEHCPAHVRVIVIVLVCTGMRISEALGLRWDDIDYRNHTIWIRRRADGAHIGDTKTDESEVSDYPMHAPLADALKAWAKEQTPVEGWVFGSELTKRPFHASTLAYDHLIPAARAAGVRILLEPGQAWHTFRHTYRALLADLGEPLEVQQALMRHSRPEMTLHYGKFSAKRQQKLRRANARVVDLVMPGATP